ncbi:MAG: hypothetical protein ABIJ59_05795 [Pseudomonadota bacterium]
MFGTDNIILKRLNHAGLPKAHDAHRKNLEKSVTIPPEQLLKIANCYHDLAHYSDVPNKRFGDAKEHYKIAIKYFNKLKDHKSVADAENNLQEMLKR